MVQKDIIQITPAENWWAVYDVDGKINALPLICWALVLDKDDGQPDLRYVEGITEELDSTGFAENEYFKGYLYEKDEEKVNMMAKKKYGSRPSSFLSEERWE